MDIHCRHCGEPWDHDELHDMYKHTYKEAAVAFKTYGCGAFTILGGQKVCKQWAIYPPEMLELIGQSQDMSPYPDEWQSPDDIECMLGLVEDMF